MSHSENKSPTTTNNTDNRAVLGERALYANNGANVSQVNNTNTWTLDGGAINSAFDFATGAGARVIDFAADTQTASFQTVKDVARQAFDAGSEALNGAFAANKVANTQAWNFGSDALASAESGFRRALDYSANANDALLAGVDNTQQLVANAYNDAKGRGALTDKIIIGAIAAMALVALLAIKK